MNADKRRWTLIEYSLTAWLINIPAGQYPALRARYSFLLPHRLSVSFIDALSQWRKQFSLSFAFIISSASICVHQCYKCLFSFFLQDERRWTPIKPDYVSFARLFDRSSQPVNIQPFGHGITLCCRQARSVGGLDAVSQSQPQFSLSSLHLCPSASINVTNASFHLFKSFFFTGWTRINADKTGLSIFWPSGL